jgi:hypothetical protein
VKLVLGTSSAEGGPSSESHSLGSTTGMFIWNCSFQSMLREFIKSILVKLVVTLKILLRTLSKILFNIFFERIFLWIHWTSAPLWIQLILRPFYSKYFQHGFTLGFILLFSTLYPSPSDLTYFDFDPIVYVIKEYKFTYN